FDPAGTPVRLDGLRRVIRTKEVPATFDGNEPIIVAGEQTRKRRTTMATNILSWKDFYDRRQIRFAAFIPPGRYSVGHPWKNEYWRIDQFDKAILRQIVSPTLRKPLQELELVFHSRETGKPCRFIISGFELAALPPVPVHDY